VWLFIEVDLMYMMFRTPSAQASTSSVSTLTTSTMFRCLSL